VLGGPFIGHKREETKREKEKRKQRGFCDAHQKRREIKEKYLGSMIGIHPPKEKGKKKKRENSRRPLRFFSKLRREREEKGRIFDLFPSSCPMRPRGKGEGARSTTCRPEPTKEEERKGGRKREP